MDLTGRKALITGGAGHIGGAVADALAECGATVSILDMEHAKSAKMVDSLAKYGNPKVEAVTGNTVSFACTDSSLSASSVGVDFPAFKLEFYRDPQLNDLFVASKEFKKFEVLGIGTIGVTNPAAVNLKTNDSIPDTLYYKFSPVNVNLIPSAKAEIMIEYNIR